MNGGAALVGALSPKGRQVPNVLFRYLSRGAIIQRDWLRVVMLS